MASLAAVVVGLSCAGAMAGRRERLSLTMRHMATTVLVIVAITLLYTRWTKWVEGRIALETEDDSADSMRFRDGFVPPRAFMRSHRTALVELGDLARVQASRKDSSKDFPSSQSLATPLRLRFARVTIVGGETLQPPLCCLLLLGARVRLAAAATPRSPRWRAF